jgi:16S rRNA (adenine1518-N6/adenine1519-N6)-dimethyltransferase
MKPDDDLPALDIPELLRTYGLRPDKKLGQNFLIDRSALAQVLEAAEIEAESSVLEIGPGLGSLTRLLARRARRVVAVELDANLLPPLYQVLAPFSNVEIVQGDILAHDPTHLMGEAGYRVVANIPYYITSALIRHLLEARLKPQRLVLTVQREVAERICATPGDLSLLALSVQVYGAPKIVAHIPAGAFYPAPKVDSAVVRMDLSDRPAMPPADLDAFFRLAKAGFSQKRKTLRNALAGGLHLEKAEASELLETAGIDPMRRAETLSMEEWGRLVMVFLSPNHQ